MFHFPQFSRTQAFYYFGLPLLFFLSLSFTYLIARTRPSIPLIFGRHQSLTPTSLSPSPTPVDTTAIDGQLNLLIAGYGGPGHAGGSLSDVIVIAHLNPQTQTFALISVPRDLYVNQAGISGKVNSAYAHSPATAKQVLSAVTGLPITYYLGIDFVGFQRAIHAIGGINVEVKTLLDDPWYPIRGEELNPCGMTPEKIQELTDTLTGFELEKQFPCRYEHLHFEPGTVFMEGGDALKFVRSRHTTSDFSRGERAQAVVTAIVQKLLSLKTLEHIPDFFREITTHISTDINAEILTSLNPILQSIPQLTFKYANLTTDNVLQNGSGASLIPRTGLNDFSGIHAYIQSQLTQ